MGRLRTERFYPGPRDIFSLMLQDATGQIFGGIEDALSSHQGHIVIRVEPGGDRYHVIIVDETSEAGTVRAIHGPYSSR